VEEITAEKVLYTVKKSNRAKRLRIVVSCEGKISVTVPNGLVANYRRRGVAGGENLETMIANLVKSKWQWIKKALVRFSALPSWQKKKYSRTDYLSHKEAVRVLVRQRLAYFNQFYHLSWKRIAIRDQKSRWGSCSRQGNLNFNYKIFFLPPELQDYIVVHELCHLQEMNHSSRFWALVAKALPDYNELRKRLRR